MHSVCFILTPYFGYKALISNQEWKTRWHKAWDDNDFNAVLGHVAAAAFVGYSVTTLYCIAQGTVKLILSSIGFKPKSALLSIAKLIFDLFVLTLLSENAIVIYNHGFKMAYKIFRREIAPIQEPLPWPISAIKSGKKEAALSPSSAESSRLTEWENWGRDMMNYVQSRAAAAPAASVVPPPLAPAGTPAPSIAPPVTISIPSEWVPNLTHVISSFFRTNPAN